MKKKGFIYLTLLALFIMIPDIIKADPLVKHPNKKIKKYFACPILLTDDILIQNATCSANDGAVLKLHGTGIGVHTYTWFDANNKIVGTDSNLVNIPAGKYTVSMHDESKCAPVTAGPFTVTNGIDINITNVKTTQTNCSNSDGAITGITVTGATEYAWRSEADSTQVIATTLNLTNVPLGYYKLTAINSSGCTLQSNAFFVGSKTVTPVVVTDTITQATCNAVNGYITIRLRVAQNQPTVPWNITDNTGISIATGMVTYTGNDEIITTKGQANLDNGMYYLKVGDPNVCQITLKSYQMTHAQFAVDESHVVVFNDTCDRHVGAIGGINWIGGTYNPPFYHPLHQTCYWYNQDGKVVSTFKTLDRVGAGQYYIKIIDDAGCVAYSKTYTITDTVTYISPPHIPNVLLCLPSSVSLNVTGPQPKMIYDLYTLDTAGDTVLVTHNTNGKFTRTVTQTTVFFVSASNGTCESAKTKTTVTVQEPGVLIPDTFTPNNDGINDYWDISGLQNYPGTTVNIYNRYGQLVYTSVGYSKPFDGTLNGMPLPTGTYYYTLDLKKKDCGATSGSITIIR